MNASPQVPQAIELVRAADEAAAIDVRNARSAGIARRDGYQIGALITPSIDV
ncbi:MAG TPA: hypothetical protein VNG89_27250 [Vicinamibacterales bacterium]|nr:hypothetical protein [Vicinamibacterales bacterium]